MAKRPRAARADNPELEALAEEAARGELPAPIVPQAPAAVEPEAPGAAEPAAEPQQLDAEGLKIISRQIVGMLGAMACARAQVAPLAEGEVNGLGDAVAQLLVVYDFGNMSPRAAAWLGLGLGVVAVASPRVMEIAARRKLAAPLPAPEPVADESGAAPPAELPPGVPPSLPDPTRDPSAAALVS